jgi:hypothetical protein
MPENPGKDLALSEPFMQFGQVLAKIGQQVQTGDVPQTVLDAFDYVKSHLQSGGKQVEDAYQTLKQHADKLSQAIVPKLHAEEASPQTAPSGWTPEKTPEGWTPESTTPMNTAKVNGQDVPARTWTDTAVESLPAVGGAIGGLAGNIPGALLGGAAGEAYKELIQRARGKAAPVGALGAVGEMAQQSVTQGAAQAVGEKVVGPVLEAGAKRLMQSALKPTLAVAKQYRTSAPAIVQTLLDEGISVTKSGMAKLESLVSATNDQIKAAIAGSSAEVPALRVAGRLSDTARTFTNQVNPASDLNAISNAGEEFLNHPRINAQGNLSVQDAQALKQGTYKQLQNRAYGELKNADTEAQKSLARGLKEEVATAVPGVSGLNAKETQLLAALDATGRRVALTGNRDPIGFAWVTHNPMTFLTALADRSPAFKSYLARGLYTTAAAAAKVSPQLIRAAVQAAATSGDDQEPAQSKTVQVGPYRVEPQ